MTRAMRIITPPRLSLSAALGQVRRLAEYGNLLTTISRHRVAVRYKQTALGGVWALAQPLAMLAIFTVVFTRVVRVPSEDVPYALFAYAGLLPWTFFSGAVSASTGSLVSHAQLVTKVYFPREILPLSYLVSATIDLLIGAIALVALAAFYRVHVTPALLWTVPIIALLASFALSCGLILSAVHVRFRDVGIALPIALQLLMFGSPVVYPLSAVPAAWRSAYLLNPLAGLIENFRRSVLARPLDVQALATAAVATAALMPIAYVVFKHTEVTVADVI
jgi:lipopolysaccharide transport system permease protein